MMKRLMPGEPIVWRTTRTNGPYFLDQTVLGHDLKTLHLPDHLIVGGLVCLIKKNKFTFKDIVTMNFIKYTQDTRQSFASYLSFEVYRKIGMESNQHNYELNNPIN